MCFKLLRIFCVLKFKTGKTLHVCYKVVKWLDVFSALKNLLCS